MTGPAIAAGLLVVRDETPFDARWYWCEITAATGRLVTRSCKLWGPQIPLYQRQADIRVHVVGPA